MLEILDSENMPIEETDDDNDIVTFEAPVSLLDTDFDYFEEEIYEKDEHEYTEWDNIQL